MKQWNKGAKEQWNKEGRGEGDEGSKGGRDERIKGGNGCKYRQIFKREGCSGCYIGVVRTRQDGGCSESGFINTVK